MAVSGRCMLVRSDSVRFVSSYVKKMTDYSYVDIWAGAARAAISPQCDFFINCNVNVSSRKK